MYRVVRASILYYENHMRGSKYRHDLIRPFMLLVDSNRFMNAKEMVTEEYLNLCDIVSEMKSLFLSGDSKYHHFDMLLKELQVLGFDVEGMSTQNVSDEDIKKSQIGLMHEFISFRYPFDEFDNKTGIHDYKTNEFVFVQP